MTVENALGPAARQTSAPNLAPQCCKSPVISGVLLNLPEPAEGDTVMPNIGTRGSEGLATARGYGRHTASTVSLTSPFFLKFPPTWRSLWVALTNCGTLGSLPFQAFTSASQRCR